MELETHRTRKKAEEKYAKEYIITWEQEKGLCKYRGFIEKKKEFFCTSGATPGAPAKRRLQEEEEIE